MNNPYGTCGHTYYEGSPDCVHYAYLRGYIEALDAAREAVRHALGPMDVTDPGQRDVALAAIDSLRGEQNE